MLVATVVAQLAEFVTVEAVEAVLCAEPHETFGILRDGVDRRLGKTVIQAVALHAERRGGERSRRSERQQRRENDADARTDRPEFSPRYRHSETCGLLQT